jgi:histidinol-phosphate aminotransferase
MGYERDNIRRLSPYVPGEQPSNERPIKLNTNENPSPPPEAVRQAIQNVSAESLRRYPPPAAADFRTTAADLHGVTPSQVIATNGGDELLRLAITVFTEPSQADGGLGLTTPTYSLYQVLAQIHDCAVTQVERGENFALSDALADQWNQADCRLAMLVNPHAPSGRFEQPETLRQIAKQFKGVLLVDEAYVDFAEGDALSLVRGDQALDNVLLLRSLSKGYSLAGLRFGYGIGHSDLIAALDKARDSYNTDVLSQAAATAALQHQDEARASWQAVIAERQRVARRLTELGFTVAPSQTNFLLATPSVTGPQAARIYESLKAEGIFVRYFNQARLSDKLRITIGQSDQNDALLAAIESLGLARSAASDKPQP